MTYEERRQYIAELEHKVATDAQKWRAQQALHEAVSRQIAFATQLYIDAISAPWRALAEELRRR